MYRAHEQHAPDRYWKNIANSFSSHGLTEHHSLEVFEVLATENSFNNYNTE